MSNSAAKEQSYRQRVQALLDLADIKLDGDRPFDIQIHNENLYGRILGSGSLGLGESFMDGWWSCEQLDEMFARLLNAELASSITTLRDKLFFAQAYLSNRQTNKRARKVAKQHYDVGNELYQIMLDKRMIYTCGYWQDANTLDEAQQHKLELVCRKLKLEPGMKVLDIGCGWGGSARYMAENYHVDVVGISISEEQIKLAEEQSQQISNGRVSYRLQDYRELNEEFDRIYSLGMFEHVGFKNYAAFFDVAHRCLANDGLFLLHTIGHRQTLRRVDPWIERYIFPNSILPSAELIGKHSSPMFNLEDWHNFGLDYHKTLMAWWKNIEHRWGELSQYDARFQRMWRYYLMSCAGTFKASRNHLWQIVFSKGQLNAPYQAVRSAL